MNFLDKYNILQNTRFNSIKKTLELCNERGLKVIVETGTSRGKIKFFLFKKFNWKDGMSTVMFADYAKFCSGFLHTCDISKKHINNAKKFTKKFSKFINYYNLDSVYFLKNFPEKIDLLYLDSLDGHDPEKASRHQLNEIVNCIDKLNNNSLVLLDDKGEKTNLSINYLIKKNFFILYETTYQVLLSKKK